MKKEWQNLIKNRFLMIALVAIILIPTIYTTIFLGSMWDPYGKISELPVAVVNQDIAVDYNDEKVNIGLDLVEHLKESDALDFNFVDEKTARKGLEDGSYYMVLTIPNDFSSNAITLLDKAPKQMTLYYDTNPGVNFIASKMSESAIIKLKDEISKNVTSFYAENVFYKFSQISGGFDSAVEGSNDLSNGLLQLSDGQDKLTDGIKVLDNNMDTFESGVKTFKDGLVSYTSGVERVNTGLANLSGGSKDLQSGLTQLNQAVGNIEIASVSLSEQNKAEISEMAAGQISEYSSQLSQGVKTAVVQQLQSRLSDGTVSSEIAARFAQNEEIQQMKRSLVAVGYSEAQVDRLIESIISETLQAAAVNIDTQTINDSISVVFSEVINRVASASAIAGAEGAIATVNNSIEGYQGQFVLMKEAVSNLLTGQESLDQGINQLSEGAGQLVSKNEELLKGVDSIYDGSDKINNAVTSLGTGAESIKDGVDKAQDGSVTLSEGLTDGADSLMSSLINVSDNTYDMFSDPITTEETRITKVTNNGSSMAAYMMTVGIWVAGMSFCLTYPLGDSEKEDRSGFSIWRGKASVMYPVAIVWAIVMVAALYFINGLRPERLGETILIAIVSALTFMSIHYFFNLVFKKAGAFLMFVFMVVQLSGSTGTYPTQLSANFVSRINHYLPFYYAINAFRSAISGGKSIGLELVMIILIGLVFAVLAIVYFEFKGRKQKKSLFIE